MTGSGFPSSGVPIRKKRPTIASMSCSLGPSGISGGWLLCVEATVFPDRNSPTEVFTMSRTIARSVRGIKGLLGRHPCTLTNRPHGLIEPTGTLSIWPSRIGQTRAMIPTNGRRNRESRMPHTSKLWQLEAMTHIPNHDTPPWLWSESLLQVSSHKDSGTFEIRYNCSDQ